MNVNDFTQTQANYIYPTSNYNAPIFQSHAEWLQAGSLRYSINVAMHSLSVDQLKNLMKILSNIMEIEPVITDSGEK